jgi:uncharacterized protein (DUF697 family)
MSKSIFDTAGVAKPDNNKGSKSVDVPALDKQADGIILKYSLMACASGLIPIPGAKIIVDVVADTLLQYQMISDLKKLYRLSDAGLDFKKILAVIIDNIAAGRIIKWATEFLKFIPVIGQTLIPFVKYFVDFAYTYIIGLVFKMLFRTAYLLEKPLELDKLPEIVAKAISDALEYVKKNWMLIFSARKFVLNRYEVDLEKLQADIANTAVTQDELATKSAQKMAEIYRDLKIQTATTKDFSKDLDRIASEIGEISIEGRLAQARLDRMKGLKIDPVLDGLLDMEDEKENPIKRLKA